MVLDVRLTGLDVLFTRVDVATMWNIVQDWMIVLFVCYFKVPWRAHAFLQAQLATGMV